MERRGFLQALAAGAAIIMLPSLAAEPLKAEIVAGELTTAAGLTAWMNETFKVFQAEPTAFMNVKLADLPVLYGFSANDIPEERIVYDTDDRAAIATFNHFVMAFGIEGDDPVEAERRLVQYAQTALKEHAEAGAPLFLRVEPTFSSEKMNEYGDTYMTWEEIQDRGLPDALPENVELDFETDTLKYVKRRYTLNKLRLRLSLPTLTEDEEMALGITEGTRPKRIA